MKKAIGIICAAIFLFYRYRGGRKRHHGTCDRRTARFYGLFAERKGERCDLWRGRVPAGRGKGHTGHAGSLCNGQRCVTIIGVY